jgi:hypothetical protein
MLHLILQLSTSLNYAINTLLIDVYKKKTVTVQFSVQSIHLFCFYNFVNIAICFENSYRSYYIFQIHKKGHGVTCGPGYRCSVPSWH